MFTKFRVRNFKTHLDTEIKLKDLTLFLGSNNSGKTNLLKAISFFLEMFSNGRLDSSDYQNNTHINHQDEPTYFSFEWIYENDKKLSYSLTVSLKEEKLETEEKIEFNSEGEDVELSTISNGILKKWKAISEYSTLESYKNIESLLVKQFLNDGTPFENSVVMYSNLNTENLRVNGKNNNDKNSLPTENRSLESQFLDLVKYIKTDADAYKTFAFFIRWFEKSFVGLLVDENETNNILWQFDVGNEKIVNFTSQDVSHGVLKNAALALICSFEKLPLIVMIEEIENGVEKNKLAELLDWLRHVSKKGQNTQFIFTSHGPSVIREFSDNLDSVYTFKLEREKGYVSEVTNLNEEMKIMNRLGIFKGEGVEEIDGVLHIHKYTLTKSFYNGTLEGL
jgi:AAA15 family ATPase/GTPase